MIDLGGMRGVRVDSHTRRVRVQGGATWAEVGRETQVFGLATPSGYVSTTGVGGFMLGGGYGYLRRKYGMTCDNLRSADIVTADRSKPPSLQNLRAIYLSHAAADRHSSKASSAPRDLAVLAATAKRTNTSFAPMVCAECRKTRLRCRGEPPNNPWCRRAAATCRPSCSASWRSAARLSAARARSLSA
jgi:FAD/FMN-containing dehydrogenase